jgi:uncharacterized membrane protein
MEDRKYRLTLGLILLLGGLLLFINLGRYDVWGDEALTFPKGHSAGEVLKYLGITGGLVHPPLYSLVQFYWVKVVGLGTSANRVIWATFGLLNIFLVYLVGKELFNRKIGLISAFLCATSPFLIQYSRMIRYYPLTALAVLLVIWSFARLRRTGRYSDWGWFTLSAVMLIYTDYLGVFVLAILYAHLLIHSRIYRSQVLKWVLTPVVVFLLFLPWLPTLLNQVGKNASPYPEHEAQVIKEAPRIAQKSLNLRGLIVNSVLKSGFLFYVFTLGETTYFWRWFVTLPVLASFVLLFLLAFRRIRGPDSGNQGWLRFTLILTALLTVIISEVYGIFGSRMFQFPSKVMFLLPLFLLLVVWSWSNLRSRVLQGVIAIAILCGNAYGLTNYYSGRQFLNPKFLVPWRQVQANIHTASETQDLILTDEEAFIHQLKISSDSLEVFGLVGALEKVDRTYKERGPHQVYLVIRYRGDETITMEGLIVLDKLKALYPLVETRDYVPMDPEAARFWERFLGKKPNPYLVEVYRFKIATPVAAEEVSKLEVEHAGKTEP